MGNQIILAQAQPRCASQFVEIPVTSAGLQQVNLPDVQQLRSIRGYNIIIKLIRLIVPEVLSNAFTCGLVNAPLTELQKIGLLLYSEGWEKGYQIPILTLNDVNAPDTPHIYQPATFDDWENVDWSKSKLVYANGTSSVIGGAGYAVCLDVQYLRVDDKGIAIKGPR